MQDGQNTMDVNVEKEPASKVLEERARSPLEEAALTYAGAKQARERRTARVKALRDVLADEQDALNRAWDLEHAAERALLELSGSLEG